MVEIDQEAFDAAVRALAQEDGVANILGLPGIWEIVSEHYNNDAISRVEAEADDEEDDDDEDES